MPICQWIYSLVREVDIKGVRKLIEDGIVKGGMIPKVQCCVRSLAQVRFDEFKAQYCQDTIHQVRGVQELSYGMPLCRV